MTDAFVDAGSASNLRSCGTTSSINPGKDGFGATRAVHEFRLADYKSTGRFVADRSFVLMRDGKACGLVPLVFGQNASGYVTASYMDAPLPWPMVISSVEDQKSVREALFDELEQRVRLGRCPHAQFGSCPSRRGSGVRLRIRRNRKNARFCRYEPCLPLGGHNARDPQPRS